MNRNSNRTWEFRFADGSSLVRQCRNSLGSFAKMADAVKAERGKWVEVVAW